jgi:pimeloyl-ACP methyl ester carboxylesterase
LNPVKIADVELELFDSGQGSPVLFLHGASGFSERQPFVAPLATKRRLIAPSHPGFGKSSLPEWLDSIDDIAHIYLEFMDKIGLQKTDLIGCSIGAWIAAEIATKVPERVGKLVMVGPVGVKVGSTDKLDIPDIFAMPQDDVNKLVFHDPSKAPEPRKMSDDELATMFRNRETTALLVWEPWMHNPKLKRRLHRVKSPALFIRGASDGLVSADYLKAYAGLLPNARTLTIPAAGHAPHLEQPEAFVSAVVEFLGA